MFSWSTLPLPNYFQTILFPHATPTNASPFRPLSTPQHRLFLHFPSWGSNETSNLCTTALSWPWVCSGETTSNADNDVDWSLEDAECKDAVGRFVVRRGLACGLLVNIVQLARLASPTASGESREMALPALMAVAWESSLNDDVTGTREETENTEAGDRSRGLRSVATPTCFSVMALVSRCRALDVHGAVSVQLDSEIISQNQWVTGWILP